MSDVGIAPAPAANTAPPSTETPINENPISSPQPIGSQAPDRPQGEQRPVSRREAIQRAYDRADTEQRREQTKPRQARMGDNNPPEETPKVKPREPSPEDFDLRKRPSEQRSQQQRGEHGHFVARAQKGDTYVGESGHPQDRQASQASQASQQRRYPELPIDAPNRNPPRRWTERSKTDWHGTPDTVRAEVTRMSQEYASGFRRYQADHETMKSIRAFDDMARQQGTTLQRVLSNFTGMEHKLRNDVVGGLDQIVYNLNLRTQDGQRLGLRDIAYHILNQSPEQQQLVQSRNAQTAQTHQIGQLHQMVSTLAQGLNQMHYEKQFTNTRSQLDRWADNGKHPRFDELGDLIEREVKLGFDIETAYRRAELLRPATAAQTRNGTTAAQTRNTDRSIHGAPSGAPSNGDARRTNGKLIGRRDAIANAIKRVNGAL